MKKLRQLSTQLFDFLHQKKVFSLFLFGFIFTAIISWSYLNSAIEKNINFRLEHELNTIVNAVNTNIFTQANTLGYLQAYFKTEGLPSQKTFRKLAESIEIQQVNHGIQGIGYISIVKKEELKKYIRHYKNQAFFSTDWLQPGRDFYAPITMVEPMTHLRSLRLGYDMLLEKTRRDTILQAIQSSTPTISKPLQKIVHQDDSPEATLILLIPYYNTLETPATTEARFKHIQGLIYIPMRMRNFFEATLGKPIAKNERVNFKISYLDESAKTETTLYERFDQNSFSHTDTAFVHSRILDVYGHKWKVTVTPFPTFFYFGDRYLDKAVAGCFLLVIGLMLSLFKQTQTLLAHEKKAKEFMENAVHQSRDQTKRLKILNEATGQANLDLDLQRNADHFFNASLPLSQATHASLFLSMSFENPEKISFYRTEGFSEKEVNPTDLSLEAIQNLIGHGMVLKNENKANEAFSRLFNTPDTFSDWVLVPIPSNESRRCGLLFLGRSASHAFTDIDLELIESLITQFGIRLDNLRLFKKVQDSNMMKTAFLSNMSHEIRTPLNAITGFSEILESADTSDEKHSLIDGIKKNTSQLTSIIDNILDISKIEFGRLFIHKKRSSLSVLIKTIQSDMELRAQSKGLRFDISSIGTLPSMLETDESRVKQILINLIGNAIKFTESGSVHVQVTCDVTENQESQLIFRIIDTGIGIASKFQAELFQSFSQIEASHTRRFGGIGLGLALSRRLAQQLGGEVTLTQSELGKGSTFTLKIPFGTLTGVRWMTQLFEDLEVAESPKEINPSADLKDRKVLIVEDSEDNQEIFRFFLNSAGAKTEVIDNGEDAVLKAEENLYDLILMDIQLPKMDGLEATRRIRSAGFTNPIIALTAHASAEEKMNCLQAGCIDLITKPVTQVNLIKRIQTIIKENNYVR